MNLPGLKIKPRRNIPPDDYTKWGWYAMAVVAGLWIVYSLFFNE